MHTEISAMTQSGGRWAGQHRRHPDVVRHRRSAGPGVAVGIVIGMIAFMVVAALAVATSAGMPSPSGEVAVPTSSSDGPTPSSPEVIRESGTEPAVGGTVPTEVSESSSAAATASPGSTDRAAREAIAVESRRCRSKIPATESGTTTPNEGVSP